MYSVTAYDPTKGGDRDDAADLLIVRARVRGDLERVARWIGSAVLDTPSADYPFRVVASRRAWIDYLTAATFDVDYTNFKDRVSSRLGGFRHDVLLSVWSTLRRFEQEPQSN